jgi:hypothetical protein
MARRRRTLALLALCLVTVRMAPLSVQGQTPPDPRTAMPERPTVATHAHTVAPGYVEIETGVLRFDPQVGESETDSQSLVKIGLEKHLQLDIFEGITSTSQPARATFGIGDIAIGAKWRLLDEAPVVGDFAIQLTVKFPTGSVESGSGTGTTDLSLLVISSHNLGTASLDLNAGFTARSGDGSVAPTRATFWTMSWGLPIAGNLGMVAEVFGYPGTSGASGQRPIVALLTGPTYIVRRYLVVDGGIIVRLAGPQATTGYAGLTWNIARLWRSGGGGQNRQPAVTSARRAVIR